MKHNYLCAIDNELWTDLNKVKNLDPSRSINSLISEGVRRVCKDQLNDLVAYQNNRNTIRNLLPTNLY